jgi:hypothetical protein
MTICSSLKSQEYFGDLHLNGIEAAQSSCIPTEIRRRRTSEVAGYRSDFLDGNDILFLKSDLNYPESHFLDERVAEKLYNLTA